MPTRERPASQQLLSCLERKGRLFLLLQHPHLQAPGGLGGAGRQASPSSPRSLVLLDKFVCLLLGTSWGRQGGCCNQPAPGDPYGELLAPDPMERESSQHLEVILFPAAKRFLEFISDALTWPKRHYPSWLCVVFIHSASAAKALFLILQGLQLQTRTYQGEDCGILLFIWFILFF